MEIKEKIIELLKSVKRDGMENLIAFLESSDFFTAPASTKYHCNFEGGLAQHSLNVYEKLVALTNNEGCNYDSDTLIICGLLHDICKTYFYTVEMRNKKDENGVWVQEPYYSVNDLMPLGHGEKSVIMISEFIKLTKEELYAIRWHMGLGEPDKNYSYVSAAYNKYPLAVYLHVADLLSTYITEVKGGE
ncbi:MAG: HD domain-containing protein [Methanobrevibacter sp.]|nr:HD domain-containing protein [Methanobrevibacter sp.]